MDVAVEVVGMVSRLCALKFSIQSASAKFPYRIRMVCGHVETRMLNLKTIGHLYDVELIINAGSGICCQCDPSKADRREYQARLNEQHAVNA
jgi:pyrroloquinoline quinone (PQQ) biosynthesis protein C